MSSHLKRWLTALVLLPLLILLVWKGGRFCFSLVVGLLAAIGLLEYYAMVMSRDTVALKAAGLVFSIALIATFYLGGLGVTPAALVLSFFGSAMICLLRFDLQISVPEMLYKQVTGLIYIPFLLGHLILIRDWDQGVAWIFVLMAVIIAGDTGAYYIGSVFGRHKLAPRISPGKTVEGAVGGLGANLLIGAIIKKYYFPEIGWGLWISLIIIMGALGQTGDLVESMLKRSVGLKDSGIIFPGHGGLLDRIDAILFAAPGLYYFKTYVLS